MDLRFPVIYQVHSIRQVLDEVQSGAHLAPGKRAYEYFRQQTTQCRIKIADDEGPSAAEIGKGPRAAVGRNVNGFFEILKR